MPEPTSTPSDSELARYLAGDAGPHIAQRIERWLEAASENRQRLDDLRLALDATEPPRIGWDPEASWQRLAQQLEPARRPEIVRTRTTPPRTPWLAPSAPASSWYGRALIAAGLGAIAVAGWHFHGGPAARQEPARSVVERVTQRGEQMSFRLADGTAVMLGPESRLRYSAAYGDGARVVELEGDGYFEVLHDAARPFVVRTPGAVIRDFGTRFVVSARAGAAAVDVAVAEGVVALARDVAQGAGGAATDSAIAHRPLRPDSVVLSPGDAASVAEAGVAGVRRGVDIQRYLGWTRGQLVFERTPLPRVVEELERWYDVDIGLAGRELDDRFLTATFRDKPVTEVLDLLAASLDIDVSRDGRRFVLSAR